MEVVAFISFFLGASWDFFTEVNVPGFEFTFAALFVGLFLASLGLRFLFMMLGISGGSAVIGIAKYSKEQDARRKRESNS